MRRERSKQPHLIMWAAIGFVGGVIYAAALSSCTPNPITPAEVIDVTNTATSTAQCQTEGRKSGSYRVYHCCMVAAGLHAGAACPEWTRGTLDAGKESSDATHVD